MFVFFWEVGGFCFFFFFFGVSSLFFFFVWVFLVSTPRALDIEVVCSPLFAACLCPQDYLTRVEIRGSGCCNFVFTSGAPSPGPTLFCLGQPIFSQVDMDC